MPVRWPTGDLFSVRLLNFEPSASAIQSFRSAAAMTTEERFDRIEHITAAIAEERRKDREEYKTLWRDNQRQINENSAAIARNTLAIADTNEFIQKLGERLDQHAAATRAADERLGDRIGALVSAIGKHISEGH